MHIEPIYRNLLEQAIANPGTEYTYDFADGRRLTVLLDGQFMRVTHSQRSKRVSIFDATRIVRGCHIPDYARRSPEGGADQHRAVIDGVVWHSTVYFWPKE